MLRFMAVLSLLATAASLQLQEESQTLLACAYTYTEYIGHHCGHYLDLAGDHSMGPYQYGYLPVDGETCKSLCDAYEICDGFVVAWDRCQWKTEQNPDNHGFRFNPYALAGHDCYHKDRTSCSDSKGSADSKSAAKGDPHLMNVKGEAFDVMQTGNMMLLEIPRGSSPATLDLALHADIERLGLVSCGPTFITSASFTGRWIGVPLEIRSGPIVEKGRHQPKHTFGIRLDGQDWLPHGAMEKTLRLSTDATLETSERMFLFQVRGLDIAVSQPKRPRTFLDIQVKGLGNLKTEIGGLLGIDDHSSVEEVPAECGMSESSLSLVARMEEAESLQWSARALL